MDVQGMKLRMDLSGSQEATIRIVEATGVIQMEQGHQQLKGEIKVGDSAQGQPMMMHSDRYRYEVQGRNERQDVGVGHEVDGTRPAPCGAAGLVLAFFLPILPK